MGWLPSVGSLKSQVSFAKEPYKLDDILQKRPTILRSLLIVAKQETCNFKASYASSHSIHLSCSSDTGPVYRVCGNRDLWGGYG